jgi:hypothetical protein
VREPTPLPPPPPTRRCNTQVRKGTFEMQVLIGKVAVSETMRVVWKGTLVTRTF